MICFQNSEQLGDLICRFELRADTMKLRSVQIRIQSQTYVFNCLISSVLLLDVVRQNLQAPVSDPSYGAQIAYTVKCSALVNP